MLPATTSATPARRTLPRAAFLAVLLALAAGTATAGESRTGLLGGLVATVEDTLDSESLAGATNSLLVGQPLLPQGDVDPTNIPLVGGDFKSLAASIAPWEAGVLRLDRAHAMATGAGVVVAVLDSGFNLDAPVFAGRLAGRGYDAFDGDYDVNDLGNRRDDDRDGIVDRGVGHGTFAASLVARVAPEARLLPIRIADDEGRGSALALANGLDYAIRMRVQVINLSFHTFLWDPLVAQRLQNAERRGMVVLVAAGNEGMASTRPVASTETTLAVGAVDGDDRRASFSNHGPHVALYAPGVDVLAAYGAPRAELLAVWSGTSFSVAFASGAAALVLQRHRDWSPAMVRSALLRAVVPAQPLEPGEPMEGGRLDVCMAVQM